MAREALSRGQPFTFTALGASMRPYLRHGDQVTIAPLSAPPKLGEVVLLDVGELGIVHRVICALPGGRVCVKGDALPTIDGWFEAHQILGRVITLRRQGRVMRQGRYDAVAVSVIGGLARRIRNRVQRQST